MTTDPSSLRQYCPSDFLYGPVLGEGRFGTVVYAELKTSGANDDVINASSQHGNHLQKKQQNQNQAYAIKMIPKSEIIRHNQIQAVLTEKYILSEVLPPTSSENQPTSYSECIMKLFLCFHDTNYLYFVLELCAGGTLLDLIQQTQTNNTTTRTDTSYISSPVLDISWVRYYACQILQAIEYLHQRGVVHRDISPQNIGLTFPKGEVRLGDFGAAAVFVTEECEGTETKLKRWMPSLSTSSSPQGRENTTDFVGTAGYVSPEMIRGNNNNNGDTTNQCAEDISNFPAMDLWSFGCIIYHMLVGKSPFHALGEDSPIQNMLDYANGEKQLIFPSFIDTAAKDLISLLLKIEPGDRIGIQDSIFGSSKQCLCAERDGTETSKHYQSIRDHSFFSIDEDISIWSQTIEPPYKPDQPNWMKELNVGDTTLKSLDSIEFDI